MGIVQDLQFDPLRMYFGEDYWPTDKICIHQPTIGEIVDFGEVSTFSSISPFTGNPTTYRLQLWENGIDWNKISEYELFLMLCSSLELENTRLIFGNFDFTKLKRFYNQEGECFLGMNGEVYIDEFVYTKISQYLRVMFNQHPKIEKAKGKATKQAMIDEEIMKRKIAERTKSKDEGSFLLPLISSMLNHPGFKYKKNELREVGIVEFMDSVQRLQVYENSRALMSGMYSGMIDGSKIDKSELNWLRDLRQR